MYRSILTASSKGLLLSVSLFLALPSISSAAPTVQQWQARQYETMGLLSARRNQEAVASAKQLVAMAEQMGPRNFNPLLNSLSMLGDAYETNKQLADAIVVRQRYLGMIEQGFGKDDPNVCLPLASLGRLYANTGKNNEAEAAYKRALVIKEKTDPNHATGAMMNLARFYQKLNKHKEAETSYLRLVTLYEKQNGDRDPRLKPVLIELASLAKAQGHEKEAISYTARAAKISSLAL